MAGVLWVATEERRAVLRAAGAVLFAAVAWCASQCATMVRHSYDMTGNDFLTKRNLQSENTQLDAYAYLLLPIPEYYSNGIMDPALESRLFDRSGNLLIGPLQEAQAMEDMGVRRVRLVTHPLDNTQTWFGIEPKIAVEPKEHLILRFEFDPARNYSGFLLMESEHSYREYHLPDSGQFRPFGVGGSRSTVITLWNSGSTVEHYALSMSGEPANDIPHKGGLFANLYVSKMDASKLPISLRSLDPYRAHVKTNEDGVLETFRVFIPGYRAAVDGNETPVIESRQHLVSTPVHAGSHEVVVTFVGTARLWAAAFVSAAGWCCLLVFAGAGLLRQRGGWPRRQPAGPR
jgi:hypothetical protein